MLCCIFFFEKIMPCCSSIVSQCLGPCTYGCLSFIPEVYMYNRCRVWLITSSMVFDNALADHYFPSNVAFRYSFWIIHNEYCVFIHKKKTNIGYFRYVHTYCKIVFSPYCLGMELLHMGHICFLFTPSLCTILELRNPALHVRPQCQ